MPNRSEIVIVVVSCGLRQQETLNMLKSAIIFGFEHRLKFIVMTENNLMAGFREKLEDWATITKNQFTFQVLPLIFPKENEAEWRNLFKPCAAQRLFLPVSIYKLLIILRERERNKNITISSHVGHSNGR